MGVERSARRSRRAVLRLGAAASAGLGMALLAACGGAASVNTAPASVSTTTSVSAPATTVSQASAPATTSSALAAVSSQGSAAATTATTAPAATPATTASGTAGAPGSKAVQLTYMSPDSAGRHEVEQAIYDDFAKANAGVTVQIVSGGTGWSTLEDKLKTTMAGGTPPDLYQDAAGYWADVQSQLVELSGLLAQAKLDPERVFALPAIQTFTDQAGKI
jgi:ABC-type glycerol-3-phosphate transport system substrate-binding protein